MSDTRRPLPLTLNFVHYLLDVEGVEADCVLNCGDIERDSL
jgi:hypothetical protein